MEQQTPAVRRMQFPAGQEMMRQGEMGSSAWLIEKGKVIILIDTPEGPKPVASMGEGNVVGEMALLDPGVRSATVRAVTDVSCVELNANKLNMLISKCEPLAQYLIRSLIANIRSNRGLPQEESSVGGSEIRSTFASGTILRRKIYNGGYSFFREGELGDTAYLVQSGKIDIIRENKVLAQLGPGRIFGAIELLKNSPRSVSAIAAEQSVCEMISRKQFDVAITSMPSILKALTKTYVESVTAAYSK